jgi:hypothetical protein
MFVISTWPPGRIAVYKGYLKGFSLHNGSWQREGSLPPFINISLQKFMSDTGNNRIQVFSQASIDEDKDGIPDTSDNCQRNSNRGRRIRSGWIGDDVTVPL